MVVKLHRKWNEKAKIVEGITAKSIENIICPTTIVLYFHMKLIGFRKIWKRKQSIYLIIAFFLLPYPPPLFLLLVTATSIIFTIIFLFIITFPPSYALLIPTYIVCDLPLHSDFYSFLFGPPTSSSKDW